MENYLWSIIGVVVFGAFVKVYWDVLQAYRSYRRLERAEAGQLQPCGTSAAAL